MDALGKNGCQNDVCTTALKVQSGKEAMACTKKSMVGEDVGRTGDCKNPTSVVLLSSNLTTY